MIKKLQRKFILVTMSSLLLVMILMVGSINLFNFYRMESKINGSLDFLTQNEGKFPKIEKGGDPMKRMDDPLFGFHLNEETPFVTRYFVVTLNSDGSVKNTDTGHIKAVSYTDAQNYALEAMEKSNTSGSMGYYRYRIVSQEQGYMLIFIDCRDQIQTTVAFLAISCIVGLSTLILMFILVSVFSRKAMRPFIDNAEKQKLFITDAGHEIKTPLAIISANADVLELMGGNNEWIGSIRNQTVRLDKLVKNLLTLSKMDEDNIRLAFTDFDLSETVAKIAGPFAAVAETKNKKFYMNIEPDLRYCGDLSSIEQLVSTLVDNAMKYSDENGMIKISLSSSKKGKRLEVFNTTPELELDNLDKLFDRFYRADASRSRETGGYGIGLSIAKSIVEAHHGKITVKSDDNRSIRFTVTL